MFGSVSDFYCVGNFQWRFNCCQQVGAVGFMIIGFFDMQDFFFNIQNILSGIGFWQMYNVCIIVNDGFQVVNILFGIQCVDMYNGFNIVIQWMLQCVVNYAVGGVFFM